MEYRPFVCREFAGFIVIMVFFVLKNWIRLGRSNTRHTARSRNPSTSDTLVLKKSLFSGINFWRSNEIPKKSP
jgi:hypothetical protein